MDLLYTAFVFLSLVAGVYESIIRLNRYFLSRNFYPVAELLLWGPVGALASAMLLYVTPIVFPTLLGFIFASIIDAFLWTTSIAAFLLGAIYKWGSDEFLLHLSLMSSPLDGVIKTSPPKDLANHFKNYHRRAK